MSDFKMNKMEWATQAFDVFEKFQPGEFLGWDEDWTKVGDLHWTRSTEFTFESDGDIPPRELELHIMFNPDGTLDEVYSIISNDDDDIIRDLPLALLSA
jgi:hypothetical protein